MEKRPNIEQGGSIVKDLAMALFFQETVFLPNIFYTFVLIDTYTIPEEKLVAGLKSRNRESYLYLYDHYGGALFAKILDLLAGDRYLAEDVLQQAFKSIFTHIETYNPDRSRLYTWMLSLTNHVALDMLRSRGLKQMVGVKEIRRGMAGDFPVSQMFIDRVAIGNLL